MTTEQTIQPAPDQHSHEETTIPQQPYTAQPVMGPDMGQPHYSYTMPGDPYQGSPVSTGYAQTDIQGQPVYGQPIQQPVQQPIQQPVYAQPIQQPVYGQPIQQPVYGQPVYQQPMYAQPIQQPYQQPIPQQVPLSAPPAADEQIKQFVNLVKDTADGNADPSNFLSFFNGIDDSFWKGLLVGAGITFVCTSETVRSVFTSGVGSIFGKSDEMSAEEQEKQEDLKAEQEYKAAQTAKTKEDKGTV
ncbi:hypothetical protein [Maridesulfovibrio ferrireducens]|uniref:hypothetical protein n=1 Tax=Maridesulfovibrio ferrireducens TaxID=246191 RepID=UPI001A212BF5|nr:hypothetical protein [Maridesulfovibrio ferrireducens]MBI9112765.1 hypothetical protein [Maridesulfovibrio ferrireducens]